MRTQPNWIRLLAAVALLSAAGGLSAAEPAAPKKITSVEGITEYRLDNGLRVLLFPDNSRPTVTVNLTVFVGSRHEGYGETGMAHLLEHMVFKGTPTHQQIPKLLQDRGARFNGTTSYDRTNYFETLTASDENLEFAIHLEADRMVNSFVKREDLVSEMTVVRSEFEQGENSPSRVLFQKMMAASYEWHNYGKSTIGNRSDIERVPIDNLQAFYRKHYQPDNAMVVVAGQFDEKKALGYLQKHFGAIPRPQRKLDTTYTEEPAQDGERLLTLRRVGDVGMVGAIYHIPAGSHEDFTAVQVLNHVLNSEPSGRLYKALVESKKAASVNGFAMGLHDPGVLAIQAEVRKGDSLEAVRDATFNLIEEIGTKGVTEEEVARAKAQILKDRELSAANTSQLAVALSNWAAQGDWRLYFLHRDRLEKVTAADVKSAAAKYCRRNNRTVGLFIPTEQADRVAIPGTPDVKTLVGDYKGREVVAAGEAFDVGIPNLLARTKLSEVSEGIKTTLLPKKTRGETVIARLTLRYGDAESLKGLVQAAEVLPDLMSRGTKTMSHQQIQDELDKQKARLSAGGDAGSVTFTIQTKRANLPAVLSLLRQVLREPTLPADQLELMRRERLAALEQQKTDPRSLAFRHLRRQLSPWPKDDVRYVPTIEEEIAQVQATTLDQVKKLYADYLGGQAGELTIVGDFDSNEAAKILKDSLAGWKASKPYARIERPLREAKPEPKHVINTPDKANAVYMGGFVLPLRDDDKDYPALVMADFILGSGSLASRLGDRVRQKEGLSYGVGSNFQASPFDKRASLSVSAICNPANIDKVDKAIREEIDKLHKDGVSEDELARAKQGFLEQQRVTRTNDSSLAGILGENRYQGRTMDYYSDLEKRINALTAADVSAAFRKHIDPKKLVLVTAGDFSKKPGGGEK